MTVLVSLAAYAGEAAAQNRQVVLELNPVHATIGYSWATAPNRLMGIDIGAGFPVWDITMVPPGEDILEWFDVGFFIRTRPSASSSFDLRLSAGLGGPQNDCSGCLPADGAFGALGGGAFLGGRHVKLGARLRAGLTKGQKRPAEVFVNLTPLILMFSYDWTSRPFPF